MTYKEPHTGSPSVGQLLLNTEKHRTFTITISEYKINKVNKYMHK